MGKWARLLSQIAIGLLPTERGQSAATDDRQGERPCLATTLPSILVGQSWSSRTETGSGRLLRRNVYESINVKFLAPLLTGLVCLSAAAPARAALPRSLHYDWNNVVVGGGGFSPNIR